MEAWKTPAAASAAAAAAIISARRAVLCEEAWLHLSKLTSRLQEAFQQ